ncbi:hypothetical protein ACFX13_043471 [Malus domestica]
MEVKFKDEKKLEQRLEELHKDVSKKQKFEDAVPALNSLLRDHYSSASPSQRKLYYGVVCRVATVLKTQYTSRGFWAAGLALLQLSHSPVSDPSEKAHLLACIDEARQIRLKMIDSEEANNINNDDSNEFDCTPRCDSQAAELDLTEEFGIPLRSSYELTAKHVGGRESLGYTKVDQKNYLLSKRQRKMVYGEAGSLLRLGLGSV